ncbi:DUF192 domain-containing protein [Cellulophaga sp. F20128]|uniref:DUF192 domain-containing protein n=1 Tax=Cellulophaga sp. F20128 TaxID=2926413 RepID=UPI001FF67925|nr:DUF192 domain-containing protein [Cellulophaga sp. F20128]MCK0156402.1 DUF192 domain-containing protein [Cellulophaga sp. F20128]
MNALKNKTLLILSVLFIIVGCKEKPVKIIERATATFSKEATLTITKAKDSTLALQLDIEIAETEYETQTGLMDRDSMDENQGMLFIFPDVSMHSFYMKNTKIALDLLYIDDNLKIVSFKKNAKPLDESSLSSEVPVQYVLEINAGLADKYGLEVGDRIQFERTNH